MLPCTTVLAFCWVIGRGHLKSTDEQPQLENNPLFFFLDLKETRLSKILTLISKMKSMNQGVRFKRGGVFMKTRKQKTRELMDTIERRANISITCTNCVMKTCGQRLTQRLKTKAESSFQSATWLHAEDPSTVEFFECTNICLLYTSPSPRDLH